MSNENLPSWAADLAARQSATTELLAIFAHILEDAGVAPRAKIADEILQVVKYRRESLARPEGDPHMPHLEAFNRQLQIMERFAIVGLKQQP